MPDIEELLADMGGPVGFDPAATTDAAVTAVDDTAGAVDEDAEDIDEVDQEVVVDLPLATHGLLMWLAGRAPDDLIAGARAWLAEGRRLDVARAVAHVLLTRGIAVPQGYLDLLAELYTAEDEDPAALAGVAVAEADPVPYYRFQTRGPSGADPAELDGPDQVVVDLATADHDVRGVWRTWRLPLDSAPWPPPKRLYLIEVDRQTGLPELTARLQRALATAGERDPQVEVFPVEAGLPAYHRLAMGGGQVIWAATEAADIQVAAVFDDADAESGPRFDPAHRRIEDAEEVRRLVGYLDAGLPLLITTATMDDIVDPERKSAVPLNFRTDGSWIWTDATTYYLREHGLAPDRRLLAHADDAEYQVPRLDRVAIHRALALLQEPPAEEPVWTYGTGAGGEPGEHGEGGDDD